jgi:hypothetical protein
MLFTISGIIVFVRILPPGFLMNRVGRCCAGLSLGSLATSTYDVVAAHARGRLEARRRTVAELGAVWRRGSVATWRIGSTRARRLRRKRRCSGVGVLVSLWWAKKLWCDNPEPNFRGEGQIEKPNREKR